LRASGEGEASAAKGEWAPPVSVIVPTKNSARTIERCLSSVRGQSYPKVELIVVDGGSTDGTPEIAAKFADRVVEHSSERSEARNLGAKISSGAYLLFLDSDMVLSQWVIEECVAAAEKGLDALYVPERIVGSSFWTKVRDFERGFYTGTVIDAVRFMRRELFEGVGGFDESLVAGEDWDLDRRIRGAGGRVGVISSPLYHDEGEFDMKRYLKKKGYYSGEGFPKYAEKWNHDEVVRKQLGAGYRLFWVFAEKGKWRRLLSHPVLAAGMYYLRFRVGLEYLRSRGRERSSPYRTANAGMSARQRGQKMRSGNERRPSENCSKPFIRANPARAR